MANRNNEKEQPPPNPFLLSSTSTFSTQASLFSRPQGSGEGAGVAFPSASTAATTTTTTATTTGPFGLPSTAPVPATPFPSLLFAREAQGKPSTAAFSSGALRPSPGAALAPGSPAKDTTAVSSSSVFGNAPTRTASIPSTLFGGTKRNVAPAAGSVSAREVESGGDSAQPVARGSSMPSVFGGSLGRQGGGFGDAAAPKIFRGSDAPSTLFGRSVPSGAEGHTSSFGQFGPPATAMKRDLFKEAKVGEAVLPPASGMSVGGSKVFGGAATAAPAEPLPSLLGKASTSFASPEGKARGSRKAVTSPGKPDTTKGRKESQSSPPEYNKKEVTKIMVSNIPDRCMNRDFLRSHFSKFGEIKRLVLTNHTRQATVIYSNHHGASRAKRKGRKLHPMLPEVKIYYGCPARRKSEEAGLDAAQAKKKAIKTLQQVHQPSDLDPYIPLQRPGTEPPAAAPRKPVRTRAPKPTPPKTDRPPSKPASPQKLALPTTPKKKVRSKSPAREAKEPATVTADDGNLAAVLEMAAQNNSDRYNILKARDKLLRQERHRTSDLKRASYLSATCPDMCPELERYMRDVQYDLSSTFEMTDGTLDHRLVTKKFSRSSADKELPLPHELRPGPVLLRTMDFLVCNVISRVEEEGMEVDVWYNYLWNRTRAVRNDLMQQQLTDATAVAIMERCTRFHIYAAARLCEEPPDLYDSKMNTEHLTKSMQTLKELYHDLGEKGHYFHSEAEFRAYEMLLSLNDGEAIVNKYSQFRVEVQKSSHVQFALKVIQAVTFNNYVKFFRLVKGSSTYLQGCLLHRYFRQVRSRALETIIRSYVPPKSSQNIPLHTLTHILGFESEAEAVVYLQCHGIKTTDDTVVLDRQSFIQNPEEVPPPVRPLLLVEKNRTVSVGEVIQGGPIPSNPLHTHIPHDSFDSQGCLKPGARDASDQSGSLAAVPLGLGLAPVVQQPVAMQNYTIVSHMKDIYTMVEEMVLLPMVREVSAEVVEAARRDAAAHSVAADLLAEGVQREVEAVGREGYQEVKHEVMERRRRKREEEERQRKALEEMRRAVADMLHTEYSNQFVEVCIRQVCGEAVWEVAEEVALQELEWELPLRCLEEVVAEEVGALSKEAIQELVAEQEQRVEAFMEKLALRRVAEHFQVWRLQTEKARRRKQSQMTFPAACSSLSLGQQSHALGWGYARDPEHNMSALQVTQLEHSVRDILKKLTIKNQLMRECAWHPLPLQHHLAAQVAQVTSTQHNLVSQYFKVLVCPTEDVLPEVMLWLRSKLGEQEGERGAGSRAGQDILQPLRSSFSFVSQRSGLEYAWVMTEVSAASLLRDHLQGAGLVLFVSSGQGAADACREKVKRLLVEMPRVSFSEIIFEGDSGQSEEVWSLVEEDFVKPCTSERLQSLLLESWQQQGKQVFITSSHLNDLANDSVLRHFLEPALRRHSERLADGKSPLPPHILIDLYNSTIDTLLRAVADDDDLAALSWPPSELVHLTQVPPLTWNSYDMKLVSQLLTDVRLPPLRLDGPTTTWSSLAEILHRYAATLAGSSGEAPVLASHMDVILTEAWASLEPFVCEEDEGEEALTEIELHPLLAPWPQLIYACASYKLSGLPGVKVYYQPHTLQHFPVPESCVVACRTSDSRWQEAVRGGHTHTSASRKRKAQREEEQQVRKVTKARTIHSQLLEDIAAEKRKCEEFEKSLENMLEVEEELRLLFNSSY